MFRKVLFSVDFSPFTDMLLGCVGELAQVGMGEVVLLHVIEAKAYADYGDHINPAFPKMEEKAVSQLEELAAGLGEVSYKVTPLVRAGRAASVIVDTAKEEDVSVIFMGAHGKGFLNRFVLGSVSEKVLQLSDRPVLIQQCRVSGDGRDFSCQKACDLLFEHVLIANDFSRYSERIWPVLSRLTSTVCAPVTILHVIEGKSTFGWDTEYRERRRKTKENMSKLQERAASLENSCPMVETEIVKGKPAPWILRIAEERNASLIVIGALGDRTVGSLLGGVAEKVLRESERPVLVLKA